MKLWFRLVWVLLTYRFRPTLKISDVGKRKFRVWPTDIDIFGHMNNGLYFSLMDVARFDLLKRTKAWEMCAEVQVHPVVVGETMTFRKELKPWQTFEIETGVLGWNNIAFFIRHCFVVDGQIYAEAVVRLRFLKNPKGTPSPAEVLEIMGGWNAPRPKLAEWIHEWEKSVALPKGREAAPSLWPNREIF
jgi:acyl-CoA thioesterase FadM